MTTVLEYQASLEQLKAPGPVRVLVEQLRYDRGRVVVRVVGSTITLRLTPSEVETCDEDCWITGRLMQIASRPGIFYGRQYFGIVRLPLVLREVPWQALRPI